MNKTFIRGWLLLAIMFLQTAHLSADYSEVLQRQNILIPAGSSWQYYCSGNQPADGWQTAGYNSSSWNVGNAELGYGDGDEATVIPSGVSGNRILTAYFRHSFNYAPSSGLNSILLKLLRDDGAVVYLNGTELLRSNMPTGIVQYNTLASSTVDGSAEDTFLEYNLPLDLLQNGSNLLAVEVHQRSATSSDISFNLSLELTSGGTSGYTDGPYVFYRGDSLDVVSLINGTVNKKSYKTTDQVNVSVQATGTVPFFKVPLRGSYPIIEAVTNQTPQKFLALSDFHGRYEGFVKLLKHTGVINDSLQWIFGTGSVFMLGDVLDRGDHQTEIMWLAYKLETEAAAAGGNFSTVNGNHELMVLTGDLRYLHEKYPAVATAIGKTVNDLFNTSSLFGKWIRARNTIIRAGNYVYLHAGYSPTLYSSQITIPTINNGIRDYLNGVSNSTTALLSGTNGPVWYRGYYQETYATQSEVDNIVQFLSCGRIFTGHTRHDEIQFRYNGKVIGVDVEHGSTGVDPLGVEGLLYENGTGYRVRTDGLRIPLFTETSQLDEYTLQKSISLSSYPNPFNPSTTINFKITQAGFAELAVYNTKGELVASLLKENLEAGSHQVVFSADNLPSGVYYSRLAVEGETPLFQRMLLLK